MNAIIEPITFCARVIVTAAFSHFLFFLHNYCAVFVSLNVRTWLLRAVVVCLCEVLAKYERETAALKCEEVLNVDSSLGSVTGLAVISRLGCMLLILMF